MDRLLHVHDMFQIWYCPNIWYICLTIVIVISRSFSHIFWVKIITEWIIKIYYTFYCTIIKFVVEVLLRSMVYGYLFHFWHFSSEICYFLDTCPPLSLENGRVSYNRNAINGRRPIGTVATFSCNTGYTRVGTSSNTCQNSGNWQRYIPVCRISELFDV